MTVFNERQYNEIITDYLGISLEEWGNLLSFETQEERSMFDLWISSARHVEQCLDHLDYSRVDIGVSHRLQEDVRQMKRNAICLPARSARELSWQIQALLELSTIDGDKEIADAIDRARDDLVEIENRDDEWRSRPRGTWGAAAAPAV